MIKAIAIRVVIVIIGISIVFLGRGFFYYSGFYAAPAFDEPNYEQIIAPMAPNIGFIDTYKESEGTILFDLAHDNNFDIEELDILLLRLISRGLIIEFFDVEKDMAEELLGEKEEELEEEPLAEEGQEEDEEIEKEPQQEEQEEEQRPPVIAFIIICPQTTFSDDEKETINDFVEKGGKLLLVADPTRRGEMNNLSLDYGLIFEPDYLYNMEENDANFRNIFIVEFENNEITEGLEKIALYTAGSISSVDGSIAFVDENTFSSLIETTDELSPIVMRQENKVLAVHDLTFFIEPNNGVLDNNQLISNIADWLAISTLKED